MDTTQAINIIAAEISNLGAAANAALIKQAALVIARDQLKGVLVTQDTIAEASIEDIQKKLDDAKAQIETLKPADAVADIPNP